MEELIAAQRRASLRQELAGRLRGIAWLALELSRRALAELEDGRRRSSPPPPTTPGARARQPQRA
jgi:hypothetical protein